MKIRHKKIECILHHFVQVLLVPVLLLIFIFVLLIIFVDSSFVTKLNNNANLLLAVLTGVYVLLTYFISRSTSQSLEAQTRPFVIASLPIKDYHLILTIKNIGKWPAYNVTITIDPSLDQLISTEIMKGTWKPFLSPMFLAPDQEIYYQPIDAAPPMANLSTDKKKFNVIVKYYDFKRKHFKECYSIDLGSYLYKEKMSLPCAKHPLEDILNTISQTLLEIKDQIKKTQ